MIAQITYLIYVLGVTAVRLDANAFLGLEGTDATQRPWAEAHPLSESATNMMAWQCHRLGGFTFQELNAAFEHIRDFCQWGPDLAYDFMTRPAVEHALLMRNADLLRLMYQEMRRCEIDPARLIHALGNHDDITYELPHLVAHAADPMKLGRKTLTGQAIRERTRREMAVKATSRCALQQDFGQWPVYDSGRPDRGGTGISGDPPAAGGPEDAPGAGGSAGSPAAERVQRAAARRFCGDRLGPDRCTTAGEGAGSVPASRRATGRRQAMVQPGRLRPGRYRGATASPMGIPVAEQLYGTLPQQFADESSFVSRLGALLAKRDALKLQSGQFCGVLDLARPGVIRDGDAARESKGR